MNKNTNGYITVEAALVVSAVLLSLCAVIMAILLIYQHTMLTGVSADTARRGAETWRDSRRRLIDGAWDPSISKDSIYGNLSELFTISDSTFTCILNEKGAVIKQSARDSSAQNIYSRLEALAGYARTKLSGGVIKPLSTSITVRYENGLIKKTLTVSITQKIKMPISIFKYFFANRGEIILNAASGSSSVDAASFIRNVDFAAELAQNSIPLSFDQLVDRIKAVIPGGLK